MRIDISKFDRIRIKTTRNIKYLSSPDRIPSPHGVWMVVGNIGTDLLVCKHGAICRVPVNDVQLAGRSIVNSILESLNGEE